MNNLFYLLLLPLLIGVTFTIDDAFGCEDCSKVKQLRIMAGYDTIIYDPFFHTPLWTDHHLTGFFGHASVGLDGFDAVTLDITETSLQPSFWVKSYGAGSMTADYKVTYQIENSRGKLTHGDSNLYSNVFFLSNYSGESDSFPAVTDIPKHSTITYTLKVISLE